MLIRMTMSGTTGVGLLAALAAAAGAGADGSARGGAADAGDGRTALVVDAAAGRDGRRLVDPRLEAVDADVRLPRTAAEARTNVRYFAELGRRIVVTGPHSIAAAASTGVPAERAAGLGDALRALTR